MKLNLISHQQKMIKLILSLLFVSTFGLLGMGIAKPEELSIIGTTQFLDGFLYLIISGLAGVGLIDLVNRNESVSHH